ncbi:MAG: S24 family peptidase [Pseudomonadota bacterium]
MIRALGAPLEDVPADRVADDYLAVPMMEGRVAAGPGAVAWDRVISLVWVYRPEVGQRRNLVAVKVWGDSMHPTIPHGAIIIIDRDQRWPQGNRRAIWAVRTGPDGDLAIKRLQKVDGILLLMSDNPENAPVVAWSTDPEKLVVGKVIWMWRSLEA